MKRLWIVPLVICLIGLDVAMIRWWLRHRREREAERVILDAAWRYGMEPALVKAVVWQESRFDASVRGRVGEIGLMQVGAAAAQEWAESEKLRGFRHEELFDPKKNALAGTWYLKKAMQRYLKTDNPLPYALADYNAGRANVLRWNKGPAATNSNAFIQQIDFPTTRQYVRSIQARHEEYRRTFSPKRAGSATPNERSRS